MGKNLTTTLAKELRLRCVERQTALNITLTVRRKQHVAKMMDWLQKNKTAATHEICKAAREIAKSID